MIQATQSHKDMSDEDEVLTQRDIKDYTKKLKVRDLLVDACLGWVHKLWASSENS